MSAERERPQDVHPQAWFNEEDQEWEHGSKNASGEKHGLWRRWSASGELQEEAEFQDGELNGQVRRFNERGTLVEKASFRAGAKHGSFRAAVPSGTYRDARIRIEAGNFQDDFAVGEWTFHDLDRRLVASIDLGVPGGDPQAWKGSEVLADQARPAQDWERVGERLAQERRFDLALVAFARAAAAQGRVGPLQAWIEHHAAPLAPDSARQNAAAVLQESGESFAVLGNAVLRGADAALLLRQMAILCDQQLISRAGLDLVNAALLLDPTRLEFHFTRSLIHMSLGLDQEAVRDAEALAPHSADQAAFLKAYLRILFPVFDFWPAKEKPQTHYDGLPEKPVQDLDAVRNVIQKYATRLTLVRQAILAKATGDPRWMLPDLAKLLPSGPLDLGQWDFERADGDHPDRVVQVVVDESLDLDGAELPALLRYARAEWNALCWLCWSVGLERVELPRKIRPPKDFGKAGGMAAARLWRCRDKRVTGGEMARQENVPGFSWEGLEFDEMAPQLADIAEGQYAEMQAMFHWLSDKANQSPWQDNLRGS